MAKWLDERAERQRQDADAAAARRRENALTTAEVDAIKRRADLEARQLADEHADKRRREQRREREREQAAARARRSARLKALRVWAAEHMGDLMIYPLAIVSAVMAIPAMAHFGDKVYNGGTGAALPIITELGMWAFAFAVQYNRRRHPERPVWALVLGVWTFAAVGASLNFLDGFTAKGGTVGFGIVMAVVSIAGVVAHQLVSAAPRRSRAERDALRIARYAADKVATVRKAVINASVARIDSAGEVVLMFNAGDYALTDKLALDPIAPADRTPASEVDAAIAGLLTEFSDDTPGGSIVAPVGPSIGGPTPPPILTPIVTPTVDPDSNGDQPGSTPADATDRPRRSTPRAAGDRGRRARRDRPAGKRAQARSIDELRADLKAAIADPDVAVDPTSAESIRRTLNCSPARARTLRDENHS